jgi:peptidoglycan/LPS O-acetylase OafA/YrhL
VILAQLAWQSRRIPRIDAALSYVGAYSYGLYLIHQPYATYFGDRMRGMPMSEFIVVVVALIIVLAVASSYVEKAVNRLATWLLGGSEPRVVTQAGRT